MRYNGYGESTWQYEIKRLLNNVNDILEGNTTVYTGGHKITFIKNR